MKKVTERRNRKGSLGSRFPPWFAAHCSLFVFLTLLPLGGNAQTAPADIPVAIMPFVGDDLAASAQLQGKVIGKISALPGFIPRPVSAGQFPEYRELHPDEPPDPSIPGNSPFVLTGEYYLDSESLEHFQLWLWNSGTRALVYTDEMIFENKEEAANYLPALVSWIFSHIPKAVKAPPEISAKMAPERAEAAITEGDTGGGDKNAAFPGLYLGPRGGVSFNIYEIRGTGTYQSGSVKSIGPETALTVELRLLRFLSFQTEAGFNRESFRPFMVKRQGNNEIFTSDLYRAASFQIPLLLKTALTFGKWRPAFYLGPCFILPLSPITGTEGSYPARISPPFGIIWGMDLGYTLGPGELFFDLRYELNLGMTIVRAATFQYTRNRISMSLGYRFGLWNRQRDPSGLNPAVPGP
jgi:hypothetical protein